MSFTSVSNCPEYNTEPYHFPSLTIFDSSKIVATLFAHIVMKRETDSSSIKLVKLVVRQT